MNNLRFYLILPLRTSNILVLFLLEGNFFAKNEVSFRVGRRFPKIPTSTEVTSSLV